jgi:hypothetical protein
LHPDRAKKARHSNPAKSRCPCAGNATAVENKFNLHFALKWRFLRCRGCWLSLHSKGKFLAMNILDTPHPRPDPEHIAVEEREKLQFRRITNALRATWRMPLIATIILLVLTVAILIVLRTTFPPTRAFLSQFHFTFPTAESGRYPNDIPFSINEILDPAILDVVYDQLELDKYGVERNQFYGAFSIRPFVPIESEISERYRQQLTDRRLSFVERERLEQQLKNQLTQDSRAAAELSFIAPRSPPLPIPVGRAIVHKVPLVWSQLAIEKKGVLRIPGFTSGANLIVPEAINRQPLPLVIVALVEASHRLDDRLRELLLKTPGILTVRDPIAGKSIRDLDRDVRDLQLFHVSPLRAQLVSYRFDNGGTALKQLVERRINDIEIQAAGLTKQAEAVGDSVTQYVQATAAVRGRPVDRRAADTAPATGGQAVPQVGETFIDRIIELTRQDREAEEVRLFIADRTQKQFELNQRLIDLRAEQGRWKELLANLNSDTPARKELDETTRGQIERELQYAIGEANAKWATLSRMEAEFAANRTGRTAEIYSPYAANRDVVSNDVILNTRVLAVAFWALVIFFLGFWGIRAAMLLTRR